MASIIFKWKSSLRGKKDARRAAREVEFFDSLPQRIARQKSELSKDWTNYTTEVSTPDMAVALEVAAILAAIAECTSPKSILDLGSGFSSYVTRKIARQSGATVKSVDDDPAWLQKTRDYLTKMGVDPQNVGGLETLTDADRGRWDLVFHDLGRMETRAQWLGRALDAAHPERGWVLLDDCHKPKYHNVVIAELERRGAKYFSLRELGCDRFGRFDILVAPAAAAQRRATS